MIEDQPFPAVGPGTSTIKHEFRLAQQVLMSVMPRGYETEVYGFDLRYRPMIGIGGDHVGVERYPDACLFTISDVTGHGIAAALMARDVSGFIRGQATSRPKPTKLVTQLNRYLVKVFSDAGIFMTFFCGLIDFRRRELVYCGAGHPPLILAGKNRSEAQLLHSQNPILGIGSFRSRKAVEERVKIEEGDRILFYTDGVIETRNDAGEEFGLERLARLGGQVDGESLGEHLDEIIHAADTFRGKERQRDDILVAGIDMRNPAASPGGARRNK